MSRRLASIVLLTISIAAGTAGDRPPVRAPLTLGGYRVMAVDFHTHSSTWSDGALTPIGLVLEAQRQGLDAIAITGHNQVLDSKAGRWFARRAGGLLVLTSQETLSPSHHLLAIGIDRVIDWQADVQTQLADIHRQGGVAIAAHPVRRFWPAFEPVMQDLDGAEICHPMGFNADDTPQRDFEAFAARGRLAAIGSSDFHGFERMGWCRTYVFARGANEQAILEAVRARRTVVYGPGGKAYGDPDLIQLAGTHPELREITMRDHPVGSLDWISRISGMLGLLGLIARSPRRFVPARSPGEPSAD